MNKPSTLAAKDGAENIVAAICMDLAKNVAALHGINPPLAAIPESRSPEP